MPKPSARMRVSTPAAKGGRLTRAVAGTPQRGCSSPSYECACNERGGRVRRSGRGGLELQAESRESGAASVGERRRSLMHLPSLRRRSGVAPERGVGTTRETFFFPAALLFPASSRGKPSPSSLPPLLLPPAPHSKGVNRRCASCHSEGERGGAAFSPVFFLCSSKTASLRRKETRESRICVPKQQRMFNPPYSRIDRQLERRGVEKGVGAGKTS
jgi:hypothetical protein